MIALLQRVKNASVTIEQQVTASIGRGLLVFLGIEKEDTETIASRLIERVLHYRIFPDHADKMNLNVQNIEGDVLIVPQFTLAANTRKGTRPGFSTAAHPDLGQKLFNYSVDLIDKNYKKAQKGQFGADMDIQLVNSGPVTFWLQNNH